VEQRKRLTIGVELAAKPDLLIFFDEPTSGLDSQTAWSIVALIRKLSDRGQAIIATIHQPSALLFEQFDRLLLLSKGGRTVYFGELGLNSQTMIEYFQRHCDLTCADNANPAEWMLEVIGAAPGARTDRDWHETWKGSDEFHAVRRELDALATGSATEQVVSEEESVPATPEAAEYAAPLVHQFLICTKRVLLHYWRTPSYVYSKLSLCFITVSLPPSTTLLPNEVSTNPSPSPSSLASHSKTPSSQYKAFKTRISPSLCSSSSSLSSPTKPCQCSFNYAPSTKPANGMPGSIPGKSSLHPAS
jgi:energy-coupling factor transporter ATP-binding protein EcfA2